jgi:hypothetical protein
VVEEGGVEIEGLVLGDFINEVRSPINDPDNELSNSVPYIEILDLKLNLVISYI